MPRTEQSQSFSVNSQGFSRISQKETLQMEVDSFTKKYEWQRRNLLTLQGVQSTLNQEVVTLNDQVLRLKNETENGEVRVMHTKMKNLQKQIGIHDKKYNDTMGEIDRIKREVETLRQEKAMYQNNLKNIDTDIEKADQEITQLSHEIESSQNTSKMSQNMMLNLKMKNQEDKSSYYRKLNDLNRELRDPKFNKNSRIKNGEITAVQNDTATLLKQRLTKLITSNKQKMKLIDNYQKNMQIIDEAFHTIKQATGLVEIEQIKNTFVKGQQQNYNLLTYVDILSQQIDTIADSNQTMKYKTQALTVENAEKQRFLSGTPDDEKKRRKVQQYIDEKNKEIQEFNSMLKQIQPQFKQVLLLMANSKFNRTNPYRVNEHENSGVHLHDSNINQYLSELEEYANIILIYKEKMNNEAEDVFSKNLLLDNLQPKQFKKKTYDNSPLYNVLDDTKDKTKGFQKILDREQLQQMAKKELQKTKSGEGNKNKKR